MTTITVPSTLATPTKVASTKTSFATMTTTVLATAAALKVAVSTFPSFAIITLHVKPPAVSQNQAASIPITLIVVIRIVYVTHMLAMMKSVVLRLLFAATTTIPARLTLAMM